MAQNKLPKRQYNRKALVVTLVVGIALAAALSAVVQRLFPGNGWIQAVVPAVVVLFVVPFYNMAEARFNEREARTAPGPKKDDDVVN